MKYYCVTIHLEPVDVEEFYRKHNIVCNHIRHNIGTIEQMNPIHNGFQCTLISDLSANEIRKSLKGLDIYVDYEIN